MATDMGSPDTVKNFFDDIEESFKGYNHREVWCALGRLADYMGRKCQHIGNLVLTKSRCTFTSPGGQRVAYCYGGAGDTFVLLQDALCTALKVGEVLEL
jgi:hypothetical protein